MSGYDVIDTLKRLMYISTQTLFRKSSYCIINSGAR